jgi:hypothetical protein
VQALSSVSRSIAAVGVIYSCGVLYVVSRIQGGAHPWQTTGVFTIWELLPALVIIIFGMSHCLQWRHVLAAALVGFNVARILSFRLPVNGPFLTLRAWYPIGSVVAAVGILFKTARLLSAAAESDVSPFFIDRLQTKLTSRMGTGIAMRYALLEAAILGYAFAPKRFSFRASVESGNEQTFTTWERNGQRSTINAILVVILVETVAVHIALTIWISGVIAGIVTALSIYSMLWLVGHARATRAHPLVIDIKWVRIRVGLKTRIDIPRQLIATARQIKIEEKGFDQQSTDRHTLSAVAFGSANIELLLSQPVPAITFRGQREFQRVVVCCDEPEKFLAAVATDPTE